MNDSQTKPVLVESLIRLPDNACSFDDAEQMLKKEHHWKALFVLYGERRKHAMGERAV